ncbi:MAG: family ATPase, partial [Mucilaginibacter sp.]|nr:family ATPase [Mucilaginibacter sp.]
MGTANGATTKKDTYLQHVTLKNYKSIKDVEIDFKPGLNVIIGKNASGKTNFINGLNIVLNSDYDKFLDSESIVKVFFNENKVEVKTLNKILSSEDLQKNKFHSDFINHEIFLKTNDKNIKIDSYEELLEELLEQYFFNSILISYGIPYRNNPEFVNTPFSFTIVNNGKVSRELLIDNDSNRTEFLRHFLFRLYIDVFRLYRNNEKSLAAEGLKQNIITFSLNHLKKL